MMRQRVVSAADVYGRYDIPASVTVEIDTREQRPLLFPKTIRIEHPELANSVIPIGVATRSIVLDAGDYRLKEFPNCCIVERKASPEEIWINLHDPKDSVRQARAFRRLAACQYPVLLVEASPSEMFRQNAVVKYPDLGVHRLAVVAAKYGLQMIWMPWRHRTPDTRRQLGEFLVHLMVAYAIQRKLDILPELLDTEKICDTIEVSRG